MSEVSGEGTTAAAVDSTTGASTDSAAQGHTFDPVGGMSDLSDSDGRPVGFDPLGSLGGSADSGDQRGTGTQDAAPVSDPLDHLGPPEHQPYDTVFYPTSDDPDAQAYDIWVGPPDAMLQPLDADARAGYEAWLADRETRQCTQAGAEYDFQREHCGDTEYRVTPDTDLPRAAWADGPGPELGTVKDAKYAVDENNTWYNPETVPSDKVREFAVKEMDDRLLKYKEVIDDPDTPVQGLELITNDLGAGDYIAGRMAELRVPGVVRVVDE